LHEIHNIGVRIISSTNEFVNRIGNVKSDASQNDEKEDFLWKKIAATRFLYETKCASGKTCQTKCAAGQIV